MGDDNEVGLFALDEEAQRVRDQIVELEERREKEAHRAIVPVAESTILYDLLKFPRDIHVRGVWYNERTRTWEVHVWGDRFEKVADSCEPPFVEMYMEVVEDNDGNAHAHPTYLFPERTTDA